MEKPSSRRWSSGGHEEKLPLRGGLETEVRAPHAHATPRVSIMRQGGAGTGATARAPRWCSAC